jgi:hypothetical protein
VSARRNRARTVEFALNTSTDAAFLVKTEAVAIGPSLLTVVRKRCNYDSAAC